MSLREFCMALFTQSIVPTLERRIVTLNKQVVRRPERSEKRL